MHSSAPSPETFVFLGFTFMWRRTAKGGLAVFTIMASSRFRRTLTRFNDWLRLHRHDPIDEQYETLCRKLRGVFAYFGLPGNARRLGALVHDLERQWHRWLSRRSQNGYIPWSRFHAYLELCPLPRFRVPLAPAVM